MAVVQELFIYPMKSARGIAQSTARLGHTGFEWDRQWMAVDARGQFISQRTHPKLAQIVPEISADSLTLRVRDFKPLRLPLEPVGEVVAVVVWEDRCAGHDQGDEAAEWVSAAVGDALRLVRRAPLPDRLANPQFAGPHAAQLSFSDGYPILVCNEGIPCRSECAHARAHPDGAFPTQHRTDGPVGVRGRSDRRAADRFDCVAPCQTVHTLRHHRDRSAHRRAVN